MKKLVKFKVAKCDLKKRVQLNSRSLLLAANE